VPKQNLHSRQDKLVYLAVDAFKMSVLQLYVMLDTCLPLKCDFT